MGMCPPDMPAFVIFLQDGTYGPGRKSKGNPTEATLDVVLLRVALPCLASDFASCGRSAWKRAGLGDWQRGGSSSPQLAASAFAATSLLPESASTAAHPREQFLCRL